MVLRTAAFILGYGLVVACIGFTLITLLSLPPVAAVVLTVPAVLLADRVGQGFGVRPIGRGRDPRNP